jgi:hypothetical protein
MTNQVIGFYTRLLYSVCGVGFQVQKENLGMGGSKEEKNKQKTKKTLYDL